MATLHLVSHSPFSDRRLQSCLNLLGAADGLLLCGDAVYALQPASAPYIEMQSLAAGGQLYALEEDLQARGITPPPEVKVLHYPGFVALCCEYARVNSWL
jgi:tRNA 2-thiouridine synthesizing protein B